MASEWRKVYDTRPERPPEIDTTSSAYVVYLRRNITQEEMHDEMGGVDRQVWVYEQKTYTHEEYNDLTSPATQAVMQAISEQTVDTVTAMMTDTTGEELQKAVMQEINAQTADIITAMADLMGG